MARIQHCCESQNVSFLSKENISRNASQSQFKMTGNERRKKANRYFRCIHRIILLNFVLLLTFQTETLFAYQSPPLLSEKMDEISIRKSSLLPIHKSETISKVTHSQTNTHHYHTLLHPRRTQFNPRNVHQEFIENIHWMNNVTASIGRNATFECRFPDLKKDFKLVWFHLERHTLLALQDSVILKNGRVSVRSHANTTFYLTIHDIRESDRGVYMCQVNTLPMKKQFAYLEVSVPPIFNENFTSSDVDVHEGSSVSLSCIAKGRPEPQIIWRREDNQPIVLEYSVPQYDKNNDEQDKKFYSQKGNKMRHNNRTRLTPITTVEGSQLNITTTHRSQTGAFLCIASNGIPSPIAKRIFLGVIFPPIVKSYKESVGVYIGSSVSIDCHIEAYPRPSVYWQKDDRMPPISDHQYEIDLLNDNLPFRFIFRLKILNFTKNDIGKYTCFSKNIAGEDRASLKIYQLERPTSKPRSFFHDLFPSSDRETTTTTRKPFLKSTSKHPQLDFVSTIKPKDHFAELEDQFGLSDNDDYDDDNQYINPANEKINRMWNRNKESRNSALAFAFQNHNEFIYKFIFQVIFPYFYFHVFFKYFL